MSLLSLYRSGHAPVESLRACESELRRVRFVAWREIRKAEAERDQEIADRIAVRRKLTEDRNRLAAALEQAGAIAQSWHGPEPLNSGHVRALRVIGDLTREALNPGVKIEKDSFGFRYEREDGYLWCEVCESYHPPERRRFWLDPESWPQEFKDWLEEYVQGMVA